jgi:hypothetical protein
MRDGDQILQVQQSKGVAHTHHTPHTTHHTPHTRPDLIGIDVDDLGEVQREQHVEEQDLVAPDDALLLRLLPQPVRPLVRDEGDLEAVPVKTST